MTQQAKSATPPSITIIDSTGVLDRNFMARPPKWAVIDGTRRNVAGVYGYFRYLQRLHDEVETDYIVHVCDPPSGGGDWRRNLLPGYKERKQKTPEHLDAREQLSEVLTLFGAHHFRLDGCESDDVIGTLCRHNRMAGRPTLIATMDKDLMQLVSDHHVCEVVRYKPGTDGINKHFFFTEQEVFLEMGVRPDQIADYLALRGDSSDMIPGIKGIGKVKASELLRDYGNVDGIITNAGSISGEIGNSIRNNLENLKLYRKLTGLDDRCPINFIPEVKPVADERLASQWCDALELDTSDFRIGIGLPAAAHPNQTKKMSP